MRKDFDRWNEVKKRLEGQARKFLFREGDIWWCSVGINVAYEVCGKGVEFRRPVLVLRKLSVDCFIGIPLSSQYKEGSWYAEAWVRERPQTLLLNQIKMFSTKRFQRRLATLDEADFQRVKVRLRELLEL